MFTADRIHLRKVTESDAVIYHDWRNNMEVMENTNPELDVHTFKETETFIQSICQSSSSKSYIIELNENNMPIGIVSLVHIDYKNRNAECIIDIGNKDYWGKGYGTQAMTLLLNYSFYELNLHKVYLRVFSFNQRAIHLYERLGFEKEGELKDQIFRNGNWHGITYLAIFQEKYLQNKNNSAKS
ncbi:GNAT family N-acetyltransferase [Thalassobacillus pellis]|uniref:GNAT family N-acetyltransferase n=1 Tax=Thalassobacillus pellis TaxID=748008 RepID=UPI0019608278|nr:GNAT family protein [Thalassobacillus pellis]MBM7553203.1 RimJ/RimL family protein N-acetyltransferase [Thalassobacillus pellis]